MNFRLVCKLLGSIAVLIGLAMIFSLPWAFPGLGVRHGIDPLGSGGFETSGFYALLLSMLVCLVVGGFLIWCGRGGGGVLYHKEAMAVVGLTWMLATVLGGLPFYLSGTHRGPTVRLGPVQLREAKGEDERESEYEEIVYVLDDSWLQPVHWRQKRNLTPEQLAAVKKIEQAASKGIPAAVADADGTGAVLRDLADSDIDFRRVLRFPNDPGDEDFRLQYRMVWAKMTFIDAVFESQSGFSTTGATVISELEDPRLVPHCILFWRSSRHFLGGLGIIVLLVVILGQGAAGKALMRAEVPGPSNEGSQARMQHTAWVFAGIYCALTAVLTLLLEQCGLSWFDALCHAFGTMATGGFSTYNASVGHFQSARIEAMIVVFMILAGMNFTLLYFLLLGKPGRVFGDIEWRAYIAVIAAATAVIMVVGYNLGEFVTKDGQPSWTAALRYGSFQVVSIITTTGYGTNDFDQWNALAQCILLQLMFVGGCAGSTGGGLKVIRSVLLVKILGLELELAHHPRVVRPLRIGGKAVEDNELRKKILVYFGVVFVLFLMSWLFIVGVEPATTWAGQERQKLIDSGSAVAATLNNIGPGLGTVGATKNYGHFSGASKLLFTWLMMLGRVEVFAILVLFTPSFWRSR